MPEHSLRNQQTITLEEIASHVNGMRIHSHSLTIALAAPYGQYYRHGWQSWSLTAWQDVSSPVYPSRPAKLHPLQTDPRHVHDLRPNGSWLGAVELGDQRIVLLGSLTLEAHVHLENDQLIGETESDQGEWFIMVGSEEQTFAQYAALLAERFGAGRAVTPPRVWCSWYSYYTQITETRLHTVLKDLNDLPFDVFQVDDGWQIDIGDWEANHNFPSGMNDLAAKIRATNRTAGLWLAPLLVTPSSNLYRQHPNWLLRDGNHRPVSAGFNWQQPLFALDTTHPEVLNWLTKLMRKVRNWGYDYLKLDFLYAGALPGKRHTDLSPEAAFRLGLKTIREALQDAYLLTCGTPILPSLGLCDGMRIGPDVASLWKEHVLTHWLRNLATPGTQNAIRTSVNRLWLQPLMHIDPDVVYLAENKSPMTASQRQQLQNLATICNYKATSDLPGWLTDHEKAKLKNFLHHQPNVKRTGRYTFTIDDQPVDFTKTMALPKNDALLDRLIGAVLGVFSNIDWILIQRDKNFQKKVRAQLRNGE